MDITKCLYESLSKMERAYGQSKKLYDALEGVDKEWGGMQNVAMVQYMETLREKMMCPDLSSVLDGSPAAEVNVKATVKEAAKLMKERRVTAVLVMDQNGVDIAGIFTSKGKSKLIEIQDRKTNRRQLGNGKGIGNTKKPW